MAKAVATAADVQTVVGTAFPPEADAGAWQAGPVNVKTDPKVTIAHASVIYEASCTFTLTGATKGGNPVAPPPQETVTLAAHATKLQSQKHVLVHGDAKQSPYGNTVKIASTRKLASG